MSSESSDFGCPGETCTGCMECIMFDMTEKVKKWKCHCPEDSFWKTTAEDWLNLKHDEEYIVCYAQAIIETLEQLKNGDLPPAD